MDTQIVINKILNDKILKNIDSRFKNEVYLVGGGVRDLILGKEITDRDLIVTGTSAKDFAFKAAEIFDGKFIELDEVNNIYRVVLPDKINELDITEPIEHSLEKDLKRRDLTINSLAVNIKTGEIIDITGGINDIENKILKGIDEKNFTDDPLRILRIFRFHSALGFKISDELMNISRKYSNLIMKPATERIEYELMKLFNGKYAYLALLKMDEAEILDKIFPFVKELKQVPPNSHHHLDLFHHSVETVKQVQEIYEKEPDFVKEHLDRVDFGGFSRLAHLKLAAFMHDIGKFSTWFIEPDTGRHRFFKHEDAGAKMCPEILKKLSFSNKQINYVKTIIKNHMYPSMVMSSPELSEKAMRRYIRKMGDDSLDAIVIAKADRLSALGPDITKKMVEDNLSSLSRLADFYKSSLETIKPLPKLLDGNDVMKILNINPSPILGKILDALYEAQLNEDITTREQAVNFVKNYHI